MKATIYLRSGHIIVANHVENLVVNKDRSTAAVTGWEIEWEPGHKPALFYIQPSEIVAVVTKP